MSKEHLEHRLTRKIQDEVYLTESSSSEDQEHLKLPSEVLRLGALIVRELNIDKGNDTLGRWMAHHLAELIAEAEDTEGDDRIEIRGRVLDLILRIWSHRRSFPQRKYPLSDLEDLVSLLWRLRPEASPFRRLGSNETEDLLAGVFRRFQRVVVYGILLISGIKTVPENVEDFEPFLDEHERELIENLKRWIEFFNADMSQYVRIEFVDKATSAGESSSDKAEAKHELDTQLASKQYLVKQTDELIQALSTLKSRFVNKESG